MAINAAGLSCRDTLHVKRTHKPIPNRDWETAAEAPSQAAGKHAHLSLTTPLAYLLKVAWHAGALFEAKVLAASWWHAPQLQLDWAAHLCIAIVIKAQVLAL
jgi:hypothetical protein